MDTCITMSMRHCFAEISCHAIPRLRNRGNPLVNVKIYDSQEMFPIRPTPGINRGYFPGFLRKDGSLIEANSNCGPVVYRGDNLPSELVGNVFIPEPAGNLIRRQIIVQSEGQKTSRNAYQKKEFLASLDERFRPVNMYNSPDGTLYVVDLYRGIIQHAAFITPYLRQQILKRNLDKGIHLGRIFRIVHESTQPRKPLRMSEFSVEELVDQLSNNNGWNRDMAQQLLVQRGVTEPSQVLLLQELAVSGERPLGRLHAFWTLAGLRQLDLDLLNELLSDSDANIRASAVTAYADFLAVETAIPTVIDDLAELADDDNELVRRQVVQTLGMLDSAEADAAIKPILQAAAQDEKKLHGLIGGFSKNATEFLSARLARDAWGKQETWKERVLGASASAIWYQRDSMAMLRFCHLLRSIPQKRAWQQIALLEGLKDPPAPPRKRPVWLTRQAENGRTTPNSNERRSTSPNPNNRRKVTSTRRTRRFSRPRIVKLNVAPAGLNELLDSSDLRIAKAAKALSEKLQWPGKDGKEIVEKAALSSQHQRLYDIGKRRYMAVCAGCHHESGYGLPAKGPPLLGSRFLAERQKAIRIVLHGIQGPLTIDGSLYNADNRLSMPSMSKLMDDETLAGVLTFARREFLENASVVEADEVARLRIEYKSRMEPWTEAELNHATK